MRTKESGPQKVTFKDVLIDDHLCQQELKQTSAESLLVIVKIRLNKTKAEIENFANNT